MFFAGERTNCIWRTFPILMHHRFLYSCDNKIKYTKWTYYSRKLIISVNSMNKEDTHYSFFMLLYVNFSSFLQMMHIFVCILIFDSVFSFYHHLMKRCSVYILLFLNTRSLSIQLTDWTDYKMRQSWSCHLRI